MSLVVSRPGIQTLIQGAPRLGQRHLGVPASGAADSLSLALANRLVGNPLAAAGLEITLSGASFRIEADCQLAVTGAEAEVAVDGAAAGMHRRLDVMAGATIHIGPALAGARSYLAIGGGILADSALGSPSTYLPAGIGGLDGHALRAGDTLRFAGAPVSAPEQETPLEHRITFPTAWTLRATPGAELDLVREADRPLLYSAAYSVSSRNDRMGIALEGPQMRMESAGDLDSRPVFPGTVQCPESGVPFLLGADAQTTGGYARIAEVARVDRYLVGQLRSGNRLRFLERDPDTAVKELHVAQRFWNEWLPGIEAVL